MSLDTKIFLGKLGLAALTAMQAAVAYADPKPLTIGGLVWVGAIFLLTVARS